MRNTIIASIIVFVIGLAAIVAFVQLDPNTGGEAEPTIEITARPDCPPLPIGELELSCLGGTVVGEPADVTVVNVWAWWCEPCRTELPLFDKLASSHPNWTVVGLHADPNAANGAALLDDLNITLPSYQDNTNAYASAEELPNVVPITIIYKNDVKVGVVTKAFDDYTDLSSTIGEILAS